MPRDKWPVYHTIMCEVDTPTTKVTLYMSSFQVYKKKTSKMFHSFIIFVPQLVETNIVGPLQQNGAGDMVMASVRPSVYIVIAFAI